MIAYHAKEFEGGAPRAHPWSTAVSDESHAYVDFKKNPELIRSSLEDFRPFAGEEFAERFFVLIEWLNGPQSLLESNDCAFLGALANTDIQFPFERKCQGRLMVLFRDIEENCQPRSIEWLMNVLATSIQAVNPSFRAGAIGLSRAEAIYKALGDNPKTGAKGSQVTLSLFAYGKNDRRCYESMARVVDCVHVSLARVSRRIKSGEVDALYGS